MIFSKEPIDCLYLLNAKCTDHKGCQIDKFDDKEVEWLLNNDPDLHGKYAEIQKARKRYWARQYSYNKPVIRRPQNKKAKKWVKCQYPPYEMCQHYSCTRGFKANTVNKDKRQYFPCSKIRGITCNGLKEHYQCRVKYYDQKADKEFKETHKEEMAQERREQIKQNLINKIARMQFGQYK